MMLEKEIHQEGKTGSQDLGKRKESKLKTTHPSHLKAQERPMDFGFCTFLLQWKFYIVML